MKLHKTTVFRMALQFAAVFAVIATVALSSVYFLTFRELEANTDRELLHELVELEDTYNSEGLASLTRLVVQREEYGKHLRHFYALIDRDGSVLAGNPGLRTLWPLAPLAFPDFVVGESSSIMRGDESESVLRVAAKTLDGQYQIIAGQAQNSMAELREHTFSAVLSAVAITVVLAIFAGIIMSRVVLSRIKRIDEGLATAIGSNFKEMLPLAKQDDEFNALTEKLNVMLARIESLIAGMRQVTDHVAHDLRSPLTRMRSRLEVTLLQSRSVNEYQEVMAHAIDDCNQLLKTFNALLSIAQAEAGIKRDSWGPVDLAVLCDELAELYHAVAEDKNIHFHWKKPSPITIDGNRQLLAQAVSNLLENAINYTPSNGNISLEVENVNNAVALRVHDDGPGIPPDQHQRALERFQRLDASRSSPGSGLGLSLVNAVAKLHNASLVLIDNHPGLIVEMRF